MNFRQFCEDYKIQIAHPGQQHYRAGWVNVSCPFCTGHYGHHLGYKITTGQINCFRCKNANWLPKVIAGLANCSLQVAFEIINDYGGLPREVEQPKRKWREGVDCEIPHGLIDVTQVGLDYLSNRGFDAERIVELYGLKQTGPVGPLRHRLFIPIYFRNHMVSYTCRGIINQRIRYLTCPAKNETIPSKEILYGYDMCRGSKRIVVVEGCVDVWKLGAGSVATFGTKFTSKQLQLLRTFRQVILVCDNDMAGRSAWERLREEIGFGKTKIVSLDNAGDAGELKQADADYFMRTLGFWRN